jgi:hypothetical protein
MVFLARALRRRLGRDVVVHRVPYRLRGWNSPQRDPVLDADAVLRLNEFRFTGGIARPADLGAALA